jgi:hypothetical protein
MDENALRDMLERATREEPPMGRLSVNALREGVRIRRRRRAQSAATAAVAAVAVVGLVPALTTHSNVAALTRATAYVADGANRVQPLNLATDTVSQPTRVANMPLPTPMATAPNGRTVYVVSATGLVTPISTATSKAGRPINLHSGPLTGITIGPSGKVAYVIAATGVIPVDLVTGKSHRMIRTSYAQGVVVAPNGKFAYVLGQQDVIPIRVATSTGLSPIPVPWDEGIVFSADGGTAYALSAHDKQRLGELIPISTTTNAVGRPIYLGFWADNMVGVPRSGVAYVEDSNGSIVPVNLSTGTAGKHIQANAMPIRMIVSPDGKALYLFSIQEGGVVAAFRLTEISTARNVVVKNISIKGLTLGLLAVSPDGGTGFVATAEGSGIEARWQLVPIHLASNKVGRPIQFGHWQPLQVVFTR